MEKSTGSQANFENLSLKSLRLQHLFSLTDDVGIIQHSKFSVPDRTSGYTTDDNARALVLVSKNTRSVKDEGLVELARKYLSFLRFMQSGDGRLHNFLSYSRQYLDEPSIGDHVGRALWGCGAVLNSELPEGFKGPAVYLFDSLMKCVTTSSSLRAKAYAIMALAERHQASPKESMQERTVVLADSIVKRYNEEQESGWKWFEPIITYDNPRLPQSLFDAFGVAGKQEYLGVAEESLGFLFETETSDNVFSPVGNQGWFKKGQERATYDQQPIEAGAMIEAAASAYGITHSQSHYNMIQMSLDWFHGKNLKSLPVYDGSRGACYDGISGDGLNMNQGAESTLAYLLAVTKLASISVRV